MAKVFVSHRGVDAVPAERLARDLQAAGHEVWLDLWEIEIGDSIVEKMNEGLAGAQYVVLCLSVAGVTAPWITREWAPAVARQLENSGTRLLPAVLTGHEAPALLADLKAADLTADWRAGVDALLRAMDRAR
ncbi:toll/interleukin-1 receptor domain-containing protein [Frankia sp. AgB1.9]|uniref:toll/interleukin-1 receptor domain-containing protein n=1 Tax=unclassified Frankia TaxID=2632575 RepID=UPI0019342D9E|nr:MULTISPECIES: toll/interleukin-1 receptor domain-containing protein [unclassified Frankia]MBL7493048.1 toll/interleukin-1 receptor domain-containing protein [Frankia sp. AgW1.1]MBL7548276.1 toll/interleukin-1 receptor domain-containing protein [Frankia sp. AgB1.9]MBL7618877.1 toll/interleukin-1 receptor domain-containing protein [Frankia sp. AgB1.8]